MTYEDKKLRYVVVDPTMNAIVLEQNAQERSHPASLAKLLTLAIAMEAASHERTKFGNEIKIPEKIEDYLPERLATSPSIKPDEIYSLEEALYWTGSRSEAQTTVALVHHMAHEDVYNWGDNHLQIRDAFIEHANERFRAIGLKDTNTQVLTGWYNDSHYTTALDIAIVMDYMQSNFPNSTQIALNGLIQIQDKSDTAPLSLPTIHMQNGARRDG